MPGSDNIEIPALVALMQTRSREAFNILYDNYSAALLGIIVKMCKDREVAHDLLQDSYIKIWKSIDKYDPDKASLFTWMMNISRNTCIDHFRSKQYKMEQSTQAHATEDIQSAAPVSDHKAARAAVQQLTQSLKHKYTEIIDLIYIYGFTQEEVAKLLSLPLGTVKTRCHSAIKQLRNMHLSLAI